MVLQCQYTLKIRVSAQGDHWHNFIKETITGVYSLFQYVLFWEIKKKITSCTRANNSCLETVKFFNQQKLQHLSHNKQ